MHRDYLFNTRRHRLLRTHVPRSENLSVALILFALVLLVAWVATTRDAFDPTERDLPIELLGGHSREIAIYTRPLKPWAEPGGQTPGAAFDTRPFPKGTLDAEWQPVGRVKHFQVDNLYEKINGEAEKFIKQGFVELAYLRLRSTIDASEIAIELFDQGNLGGSLGVFAEHAAGRAVEDRDGVSFVSTAAGVIGRKGRYFFRVAGDRQSPAITEKAARLMTAFAKLGGESDAKTHDRDAPVGFALLNERLGIAEADIQFQEDNVFQYDFARRFWFGDAGVDGNARLFVHIADDATAAQELVTALVEEHRVEYDTLDTNGAFRLFRHRFLGTHFVVAQRGRYVYGVEALHDTAAVTALLERIRASLGNDAP